ncbi:MULTISPECIES: PAS domain-containing sensor histidine kinase [unclassified Streptomyces]|uniref:PAS domain-containing sensor histidine kinase n=1 Tax=unclassified Streptomyces TaxID=2593676 RepID=UPI0007C670F3|nr:MULTISPECIES: PAS domain-containing sensor histidine kinase [unclassified Streptomyces]THA33981.1 PAS domain-containing sensor histidine kinase [Streptomyces sp. A1547]
MNRDDRAERSGALAPTETAFTLLVTSVLDYGIFMLDPGGHVSSWNAGAERIKGFRAADIIGQHFSVFYPPEDIAARKPHKELETAIADGRLEDEGWRIRKDGSRFWANVVITPLFDESGELRGFGKVTRDMTERRAAEQALTERRRLFTHLVQAQELERRRIAWDVHDDSIQAMVAVGMRLQLLADQAGEPYARELSLLDASVREAVSRLRNLTFRLQPPGIDRHGLIESLSQHLNDVVAGSWGLEPTLEHDMEKEPAPETAITIFRIVQEALLNVRKHARARTVRVSVTTENQGLQVQVADDGTGHAAGAHRLQEHFGLMEMRERAETAGGWWTLRSEPGTGTTVEFWVPDLPTGELDEPLPGAPVRSFDSLIAPQGLS